VSLQIKPDQGSEPKTKKKQKKKKKKRQPKKKTQNPHNPGIGFPADKGDVGCGKKKWGVKKVTN